ncbi:MAG: bifunctional nuclease family protein [Vampirovibrionales bacterium]
MMTAIEMRVIGIALDTRTGTPIVVLNDTENRRALPIWIGTAEASAIIRQLEQIHSSRPMTHDLLCNMVETLGYKVLRVEINDLNTDTYYASVVVKHQELEVEFLVDARPSDAIAIALRAEVPIFVTPNVIANGTISTNVERDEEEARQFQEFVSNLKASDFIREPFDKDLH